LDSDRKFADWFDWPDGGLPSPTVGETLFDLMRARKWKGAKSWRGRAAGIAPTLVGGSKLHGGPDLGPTRSKLAWRDLSVDGHGIADKAPDARFPVRGFPKLTVRMTARLQRFSGRLDVLRSQNGIVSAGRQRVFHHR
jgi:DNA (cytosine-5)-methyltransferase 1